MGTEPHEASVPRLAYSKLEVAQSWGVSVGAVDALLRAGELVGFRVGRRVLVPVESIDAYQRRHSTDGAEK
jgi:excisionase family DNA binding protein